MLDLLDHYFHVWLAVATLLEVAALLLVLDDNLLVVLSSLEHFTDYLASCSRSTELSSLTVVLKEYNIEGNSLTYLCADDLFDL